MVPAVYISGPCVRQKRSLRGNSINRSFCPVEGISVFRSNYLFFRMGLVCFFMCGCWEIDLFAVGLPVLKIGYILVFVPELALK